MVFAAAVGMREGGDAVVLVVAFTAVSVIAVVVGQEVLADVFDVVFVVGLLAFLRPESFKGTSRMLILAVDRQASRISRGAFISLEFPGTRCWGGGRWGGTTMDR